jgi:hypothetical protein
MLYVNIPPMPDFSERKKCTGIVSNEIVCVDNKREHRPIVRPGRMSHQMGEV